MNSVAVMQPYFFPYIGYYQLIEAADTFVFYDDVNFIKNGWINRNRILINGEAKYFTIPCSNVSSFTKINEVEHALDDRKRGKLLKKISFTYSNAPYFDSVYPLIEATLKNSTSFISEMAIKSLEQTSRYLGLQVIFKKSSNHYNNQKLDAADRLIDITKKENSQHYINAIGGKKLYDKDYFMARGIKLSFLEPNQIEYEQFGNEFVPWLSIIDVMMFNSPSKIKNELLTASKLI